MTNAERAARAGAAFKLSDHYRESNDEITNLYDFVTDLLHYADTLDVPELSDLRESNGELVHRMADYHYQAEVAEELGWPEDEED